MHVTPHYLVGTLKLDCRSRLGAWVLVCARFRWRFMISTRKANTHVTALAFADHQHGANHAPLKQHTVKFLFNVFICSTWFIFQSFQWRDGHLGRGKIASHSAGGRYVFRNDGHLGHGNDGCPFFGRLLTNSWDRWVVMQLL
jgi:hypothetical protein